PGHRNVRSVATLQEEVPRCPIWRGASDSLARCRRNFRNQNRRSRLSRPLWSGLEKVRRSHGGHRIRAPRRFNAITAEITSCRIRKEVLEEDFRSKDRAARNPLQQFKSCPRWPNRLGVSSPLHPAPTGFCFQAIAKKFGLFKY